LTKYGKTLGFTLFLIHSHKQRLNSSSGHQLKSPTLQRPESVVYGCGNFMVGLDPKFFHKLQIQSVSEK